MKKEITNCFTWYASKIFETTQYINWSDKFCRGKVKKSTDIFLEELSKNIDWNNLTEDICENLGFREWKIDNEEIEKLDSQYSDRGGSLLSISALNKRIFLIPFYLIDIIPIGIKLTSIDGHLIEYDGSNIDKDVRFGCIAYGIKLSVKEAKN